MLAILAFVGYTLATIFFFSGGAAAWKRIQTSKGWNSDEAMTFVFGAMAAIAFSIYFFIHYQGVPLHRATGDGAGRPGGIHAHLCSVL
jgi:hypothetical protein